MSNFVNDGLLDKQWKEAYIKWDSIMECISTSIDSTDIVTLANMLAESKKYKKQLDELSNARYAAWTKYIFRGK
jgi:hypothetical protein